jgi:alanyl-tRNA synthetase
VTERLYYTDSFLHEFEAHVVSVRDAGGRLALTLDRSAFYPSSGGQNFDTGWLQLSGDANSKRIRVAEVMEDSATGDVLHILEFVPINLHAGAAIRGTVDADRRIDHMQQHSGQHVLSAAFERLYTFATASFHMGEELCTIDLATLKLTAEQVREAERLANQIIAEDRAVEIRFATAEEAQTMGVRKIPPAERDKLRLIDISGVDLNACGGTHVHSTGQIGAILLRKTEKVRQGMRVEFVCGLRAVAVARHDFETLTESAALFSTHIYEVPAQIRKSQEDHKVTQKAQHHLLEEVAELQATRLLQAAEVRQGQRLVVQYLADRDLVYLKMLAQKLTKSGQAMALLGCGGPHPALVFAQAHGSNHDMRAVMKQVAQSYGIRGGGTRDMAQGTAPDGAAVERALHEATSAIG